MLHIYIYVFHIYDIYILLIYMFDIYMCTKLLKLLILTRDIPLPLTTPNLY